MAVRQDSNASSHTEDIKIREKTKTSNRWNKTLFTFHHDVWNASGICRSYGHEAEGRFAKLLSLQVSEESVPPDWGPEIIVSENFPSPAQRLSVRERKGVCRRYGPGKYMDMKIDMEDGDLFHWEAYGCRWGGRNCKAVRYCFAQRGVSVGYSRIYNRSHIQD